MRFRTGFSEIDATSAASAHSALSVCRRARSPGMQGCRRSRSITGAGIDRAAGRRVRVDPLAAEG